MTANEQQLFIAASKLIDFAVKVRHLTYDHELVDLPHDIHLDAVKAIDHWDRFRGDIGAVKNARM